MLLYVLQKKKKNLLLNCIYAESGPTPLNLFLFLKLQDKTFVLGIIKDKFDVKNNKIVINIPSKKNNKTQNFFRLDKYDRI